MPPRTDLSSTPPSLSSLPNSTCPSPTSPSSGDTISLLLDVPGITLREPILSTMTDFLFLALLFAGSLENTVNVRFFLSALFSQLLVLQLERHLPPHTKNSWPHVSS